MFHSNNCVANGCWWKQIIKNWTTGDYCRQSAELNSFHTQAVFLGKIRDHRVLWPRSALAMTPICPVWHTSMTDPKLLTTLQAWSYVLYRHRILMRNCIRRIEWHHLRTPTATGSAEIAFAARQVWPSVSRPTARMSRYLGIRWAYRYFVRSDCEVWMQWGSRKSRQLPKPTVDSGWVGWSVASLTWCVCLRCKRTRESSTG